MRRGRDDDTRLDPVWGRGHRLGLVAAATPFVPIRVAAAAGRSSLVGAALLAAAVVVLVVVLLVERTQRTRTERLERARLTDDARRSRLEAQQARSQINLIARAAAPLALALERPEDAIAELAVVVIPEFADLFAVDLMHDGNLLRVFSMDCDSGGPERAVQQVSLLPEWQAVSRRVMANARSELAYTTGAGSDLDGADDPRRLMLALGLRSWVVAPIHVGGTSLGAVTMATGPGRRGYRSSDGATITDLVARLSVAFERSRLYAEARTAAQVASDRADELNHLYQDVRNREQRLQALIEASPLAILELNTAGEVCASNPAARDLFPEPPPALSERLTHLARLAARGERGEVELSLDDPAGERHHLWISTAPVYEGDGSVRMLAVITDMTARVHLEEQLARSQRFEAIASLAGGVAHDFNNLLTIILGYSEMLLQDLDPLSSGYDQVGAIRDAGDHAAVITNQLLALSRHQLLQPETVDPAARCEALLPMLGRLAGEAVTIEVRHDASAPIRVDPGQLEQVLFNLVLNSRDAMPQGGGHITIDVSVRSDGDGEELVAVRVIDDGGGMDAETLARCQEPFFTTKGRSRGIGLGLATVANILERSGGRLEITSEPGHGTSATVLFPRAPLDGGTRRLPTRSGSVRVLVVDDDEQVRRLVTDVLEYGGYHVTAVANGETAIVVAAREPFDLLVTDVVLPGIDGLEVVRAVREQRPLTACLIMTGYANVELADRGTDVTVLPKPFTPEELLRAAAGVVGAVAGQGSKR